MKNLLITTSALVAVAGAAAADGHAGVSLSGWAEMGISSVDGLSAATNDGDPILHTGVDVKFSLAGETDGGLSFGATIELDEAGNTGGGVGTSTGVFDDSTKASVFISGGFGSLTMGDTDGALDWAMTETAMGTAINDDHTAHAGYNGNDGGDAGNQTLRYDNTFGDFGVAVSVADIHEDDVNTQVGVKYNADLGGTVVGFGLGYADQGDASLVGVSATAAIAGFNVVLNYSDGEDGAVDVSHMGVGIGYTVDALSLHANWGEYDVAGVTTDGYGLTVNYDLGGGAVVALGYGSDDVADRYSLGLRMDF